jgi:hypothetical protein
MLMGGARRRICLRLSDGLLDCEDGKDEGCAFEDVVTRNDCVGN